MFFVENYSKNSKKKVLQLVESVKTEKGPRKNLVVSLGTQLKIPKKIRRFVAKRVHEKLLGVCCLFPEPEIELLVDKIVKKIQIEGKWEANRKQVIKHKKDIDKTETAMIFVDQVQHSYGRELGSVLIGHHFWEQLMFDSILTNCGFNPTQIKTAEISILNRLIAQDSEHAIPLWLQTVAIEELLGLNISQISEDRFYRVSDKMLKHQEEIEKGLYNREVDLFNLHNSIFFYDLTNSYFEGVCANNTRAEYGGHQKEKRNDCPQLVVALVLDGEGFLRRHKVFNGKMSDAGSLKEILRQIKSELDNEEMPTLIFDRGVVSEDNMKLIEKYNYVIACRSNEEKQFIESFATEQFEILRDGTTGKSKIEYLLKESNDEVYLLCKSSGRKEKETAMRNKKENILITELENLSKQIINGREKDISNIERKIGRLKERYSSVAKYYRIDYFPAEFSYKILSESIINKKIEKFLQKLVSDMKTNKITFPALQKKLLQQTEKYPDDFSQIQITIKSPKLRWCTIDEIEERERIMDGNYLLKTNRKDLNGDEIWHLYMMLTRIENAFRDLKSHLGLRPNYHQITPRVDGHVFISILAYHLLHSIEYKLRENKINSRWSTIKRVVSSHHYCTIQIPTVEGSVINVRKAGVPETVHQEIYNNLGVKYDDLPIMKTYA